MNDQIYLTISMIGWIGLIAYVIFLSFLNPENLAARAVEEKKRIWRWRLACHKKNFFVFFLTFAFILVATIAASFAVDFEKNAAVKILFSGLGLNLVATIIYEMIHNSSESYNACLFKTLRTAIPNDGSEQSTLLNESRDAILGTNKAARDEAIDNVLKINRNEKIMTSQPQ